MLSKKKVNRDHQSFPIICGTCYLLIVGDLKFFPPYIPSINKDNDSY